MTAESGDDHAAAVVTRRGRSFNWRGEGVRWPWQQAMTSESGDSHAAVDVTCRGRSMNMSGQVRHHTNADTAGTGRGRSTWHRIG